MSEKYLPVIMFMGLDSSCNYSTECVFGKDRGDLMYKESSFETNIKWFVYGSCGVCSLCHIVLLFKEIKLYSGAGVMFNSLYHLIALICPILLILAFFKNIDSKEVWAGYLLAAQNFMVIASNICMLTLYISKTQDTKGLSVVLIVFVAIMILLDLYYSFVLFRYGMDKITCILPIIMTVVTFILKACVCGSVDSKIYKFSPISHNGSVLSVWTIMYFLFYLIMFFSIILYIENEFLRELLNEPKNILSKKSLYGTYTNTYLKEEKKTVPIVDNLMMTENNAVPQNSYAPYNSMTENIISNVELKSDNLKRIIGICPDCGNNIFENDNMCKMCGCPTSYAKTEENIKIQKIKCPECSAETDVEQKICNNCGFPIMKERMVDNRYGSVKNKKNNGIRVLLIFLLIISIIATIVSSVKYKEYDDCILECRQEISDCRQKIVENEKAASDSYDWALISLSAGDYDNYYEFLDYYDSFNNIVDVYEDIIDNYNFETIPTWQKRQRIARALIIVFALGDVITLIFLVMKLKEKNGS